MRPSRSLADILHAITLMRSAILFLLGWTIFLRTNFAQEAPLPSPGGTSDGIENLGESLLLSEPLKSDETDLAASVDEPVSLVTGDNARSRSRWRIEPHVQVKRTYDDNIFILPKKPVGDYVVTFAPGLALGFWNSNEARERFLAYRR